MRLPTQSVNSDIKLTMDLDFHGLVWRILAFPLELGLTNPFEGIDQLRRVTVNIDGPRKDSAVVINAAPLAAAVEISTHWRAFDW